MSPLDYQTAGNSMKSDQMFGWKPVAEKMEIPPIPLCFGLAHYNTDEIIAPDQILYLGPRYKNSYKVHEAYADQVFEKQRKLWSFSGKLEQHSVKFSSYSIKLPKLAMFNNI